MKQHHSNEIISGAEDYSTNRVGGSEVSSDQDGGFTIDDHAASYFFASQNQALRSTSEEVIEIGFRIRGLKLGKPATKRKGSKITHPMNEEPATTTTTTTTTTTVFGESTNNKKRATTSSLFSRARGRLTQSTKSSAFHIPTACMIKVFALPRTNSEIEQVDVSKFREMFRSEVQHQVADPIFSALMLLPVHSSFIKEFYDRLPMPPPTNLDISLRFQLWATIDGSKSVHWGTAVSSLSAILKCCGFVPESKKLNTGIVTASAGVTAAQKRRPSAIAALQNVFSRKERSTTTDSTQGGEMSTAFSTTQQQQEGWFTLNFIPEQGQSAANPVFLDVRVSKPSRLLSAKIPSRADELIPSTLSIGPNGPLLRSRLPLQPLFLRGFINAPVSRAFQREIPESRAKPPVNNNNKGVPFVEFREELAEMPLNLLIPASFIRACAKQLVVKMDDIIESITKSNLDIMHTMAHHPQDQEISSQLMKQSKWQSDILSKMKERIESMNAHANDYEKLWRKCVNLDTTSTTNNNNTNHVDENNINRRISARASINRNSQFKPQQRSTILSDHEIKGDGNFSVLLGSEIEHHNVLPFDVGGGGGGGGGGVGGGVGDGLNDIDLGDNHTIFDEDENDDDPLPEDAEKMRLYKQKLNVAANNVFFRKSMDRKSDQNKFIPINLHLQMLTAHQVYVTNAGNDLTNIVISKKESIANINNVITNGDSVLSSPGIRRIRGSIMSIGNFDLDDHKSVASTTNNNNNNNNTQDDLIEHFYYDTITVGAPAAHNLGFDGGRGLKSLEADLEKLRIDYTKNMKDGGASISSKFEMFEKMIEHDLLLGERRIIVYSQALATIASAILARIYVMSTNNNTHNSTTTDSSGDDDDDIEEEISAIEKYGFLVEWESLLTTAGNELGMLEDMYDAISFISRRVFIRLESKDDESRIVRTGTVKTQDLELEGLEEEEEEGGGEGEKQEQEEEGEKESSQQKAKSVFDDQDPIVSAHVTRAATNVNYKTFKDEGDVRGDHVKWIVSLNLPSAIVRRLPNKLQDLIHEATKIPLSTIRCEQWPDVVDLSKLTGKAKVFSIRCICFTQGINEYQTIANKTNFIKATTALQEVMNHEATKSLNEYCDQRFGSNTKDGTTTTLYNQSLFAIAKLNKAVRNQNTADKNAAILQMAADLVRWLGGIRIISCKSAKDRTAMSITLEEARLLTAFHGLESEDVLEVANLEREHGVRLINVLKNTGVPRYAFNTVQRRMLPVEYRPPTNTIGSIFSRGNQT